MRVRTYMPALSDRQRKMMAIAEHHPDKLYSRNKSALKMNHSQLHDFAATKNAQKKPGVLASRFKSK